MATALLKLGVFGAGAYLSFWLMGPHSKLIANYFVGLVFGAVVIVWHARSVREWIDWRTAAFLASSTLIWILVYRLFWILGLPASALGTILLTVAQGWLLGTPRKRILIGIPCILGIWFLGYWYLSHVVFNASKYSGLFAGVHAARADAITHSIPIWQGAYLLCMFGSIPQFLKARFLLSRKT